MNNLLPPRIQDFILWPLVAVCLVLGAVSGGVERALYLLAAIFLFALSRQQSSELIGIVSDIQKRLAALSRELIESAGALDKRVVFTENELKRLGADIEMLKIPPPRPAFARAFAAGVMMLIIGCCLVFLLLRSDLKTIAYRLDRYENSLDGTQERVSTFSQRGDELLNRVSLAESRLQELSTDVTDRMLTALAQCVRPSWSARQASSAPPRAVISEPARPAPSPAAENPLKLVSESAQPVAESSTSQPPEPIQAVKDQSEPRASAAFRSFRQEH